MKRRIIRRILICCAVVLILPAPIVWLPDFIQPPNLVCTKTFPNGRKLKIIESPGDFYRRELWDWTGTNYAVTIIDGDATKAWFAYFRKGKQTNLVDIHFLSYHGTYDLVKQIYIFKDGYGAISSPPYK